MKQRTEVVVVEMVGGRLGWDRDAGRDKGKGRWQQQPGRGRATLMPDPWQGLRGGEDEGDWRNASGL